MERHLKSSVDGLERERQSSNPETHAAEADTAIENPADQHPNSTKTPAPKETVSQPGFFLPAGWETRLAENGRVYFVDHNRRTTTWLDPSKNYSLKGSSSQLNTLPNGWEIGEAENGKTYFIDHDTRITTWEDPRSTDTRPREAPVPKPNDVPSGREKGLAQKGGTMLEGPSLPNLPNTDFPLRAKI